MKQFQQKQKVKARIYSKPMLIGLIVVCLFLLKAVFNIYIKYKESNTEKQIALEKLEDLKEREEGLKKEILDLQSPEGQEEEIRKKFNVAKPGERVIVVVEDEEGPQVEEKKGFFEKVGDFVLFWR